jgi:catechol 2,3-dioxygenase-like lactoylglutathione lyase family enzyme
MVKPTLDQINLVCGDPHASIAFFRRLGVDIPNERVWRSATGIHHVSAIEGEGADQPITLDLDSTAFAPHWNAGWKGRTDLRGRVVIGFSVPAREDVDLLYHDMVAGGYRGLQEPWDAFWGARYAIIEDPDGIAVGMMSPVSPDMKSPPPDV